MTTFPLRLWEEKKPNKNTTTNNKQHKSLLKLISEMIYDCIELIYEIFRCNK